MQNTTPLQSSQEPLNALATQLGDSLMRRYGVRISASEVVEMLAESVQAGLTASQVQQAQAVAGASVPGSVEDIVRIARDEGVIFRAVTCEGQTRLEKFTASNPESVEVLGTFSAPIVRQLSLLTGTEFPENVRFSTVVQLSDGSTALLKVENRPRPVRGDDYVVHQYTVSAAPAKAPALALDQLGITQVRHWREATSCAGLSLILGTGVRTTLRATADELLKEGLKVVWVAAAAPDADLSKLNADVLVFERALREPRAACLALKAAQNTIVLASCLLPEASQAVDFLIRCAGEGNGDNVASSLNATLRQQLFAGVPDNDGAVVAPVLATECIAYFDTSAPFDLMNGELDARWLVIDVAEKVRAGLIDEDVARDRFDELDVYL
ncbi:hypothetical protein [Burkholderia cenocepacia]|uniref:hypothetical protein n=1 Tax=Burkholderia cenocepacia TaxID=95486 RepID=UPI00076D9740|nr:hypothetical protein [Burkholderia cenocepacia]KWU19132.1 hypothetical protein AS149_12860 [Burkholderia cenocepacia]